MSRKISALSLEERRRRHRNERIFAGVLVILFAAGTVATIALSRRAKEELERQTTYVPPETPITPEVELLQEYIRFDTTNPPGNELPAAQWLAGLLREGGAQAEVIVSAPNRGSVYARIRGKREGTALLLLHHIDVVAADAGQWSEPPFSGTIRLDQLYGRGTIDMKGTGICFLRAFLDVARSGTQPEHDLVFLAVADEEVGAEDGMRWLLENRPDVIAGVRYALNEGGITEMRANKVTYYGIEIGTKLQVTLDLTAPTREQLQRARVALEPFFTPDREPHRILPEVREFFREIAPQRIEFQDELADIDHAIATGRFWRLPIGYRELTQNNVFAYGIHPGDSGGFRMRTVLLNLPDEDPDRRIEWLTSRVRPFGVEVVVERKEGPVPSSSTETPFYRLLKAEAAAAFGAPVGTEFLNRSYSDSRFLRTRGIDAYGINPFPIDFFQAESIHGVDERIAVAHFVRGVEFTRQVVGRYAAGTVTQSVSTPVN